MSRGELTVPAQLDSLVLISEFVNSATHHAKMTERDAWHMQLAVDEAATNIVQHAYANRSDGVIELTARHAQPIEAPKSPKSTTTESASPAARAVPRMTRTTPRPTPDRMRSEVVGPMSSP